MESYQVAIIGGGPAGCSCAIALSRLGVKKIVLLENSQHKTFRIGESISPESKILFRKLGIWNAFKAEKHDPCYGSCSYWGNDKRGYNDFLLSPYGHGWHLDRSRFNRFLLQEAIHAGVFCLENSQYQKASPLPQGGFQLELKNAHQTKVAIQARLVVDATGARAFFAQQQGSKKQHAPPLVCLAARFSFDPQTTNVSKLTQIEASEYGWWYAAQLPQNTFLVALYTDAATIKKYQLQQIQPWLTFLHQMPMMHESTLGMHLIEQSFKGFPAPSFCLDKIVGKDWIAIGDAAMTYDPILSQGILKSIANGLEAAPFLQKKLQAPKSRFIDFQTILKEQYRHYLDSRQHFYLLENRWPESTFWAKYQQKAPQSS